MTENNSEPFDPVTLEQWMAIASGATCMWIEDGHVCGGLCDVCTSPGVLLCEKHAKRRDQRLFKQGLRPAAKDSVMICLVEKTENMFDECGEHADYTRGNTFGACAVCIDTAFIRSGEIQPKPELMVTESPRDDEES